MGEYGVFNQFGFEWFFVIWMWFKIFEGIEIDLFLSGVDWFGMFGIFGNLDNCWGVCIGVVLILLFVKDVMVVIIVSQMKDMFFGMLVNIISGQNMLNLLFVLVEEVIK